MAEKPRIGVTGNSRRLSPSWICTRMALFLAGAKAERISLRHNPEDRNLSALIIGGGDDISPENLGLDVVARSKTDPDRDRLEIHWIEKALQENIPLLGICRGAQLINVVMGGTLHQNSLHSQAINQQAEGLQIVGRDLDDIVQAVQSADERPIIGVQWHPEYLFYLPAQMALFRWLLKQ